jgi:hypothetical protein
MTRYLTQSRWWLEVTMSGYGMWFGGGVFWTIAMGFGDPLYWLGITPEQQSALALTIMVGAFVHAMGIFLNGGWRFSPLLRAAGMGVHALALTYITAMTLGYANGEHGVPSGFWTYSGLAFVFWMLTISACQDLSRINKLRPQHG